MLAVPPHAGAVQQLLGFATQLRHVLQWTEEILAVVSQEGQSTIVSRSPRPWPADSAAGQPSSIVDRMTFCVRWKGRACYLGDTLPFRFLERLAARPNQFFSYHSLLEEVWDGKRSREAVRSVVKVLRQKLTAAGMNDLAGAIDGSNPHHYRLLLEGSSHELHTGFPQVPPEASHSMVPQY